MTCGRVLSVLVGACVLASAWSSPARAGEPLLDVELVVAGLDDPTWVTTPRGDERLFVLEQHTGRIELVVDGQVLPTPFLDLGGHVAGGGERGLLGLAFHPDYATNGFFYITYNNLAGDLMLVRHSVDPTDPDRALAGSSLVLLQIPKSFPQHNGAMLEFGPHDGMLYMSTGDGSAFNDSLQNGQNLGTLLGKILRLDVDGGSPYAVPLDNPFVGTPGARGEIFAYGLRNPWRFGFDRATGNLFIGDVGQGQREEIDFIAGTSPGGQNFGWSCLEGTLCTGLSGCACPLPQVVAPLHEYGHAVGCAVIGGRVYRGPAIPGLRGAFVFGDYCTNQVWALRIGPGGGGLVVDHTAEVAPGGGTLGLITAIGEDGDGELLIVGQAGEIHRVIPAAEVADCDGDGISDADEITAGTAFDANLNGLPDDCELLLTSTDVVVGQSTTLEVVGGAPGQLLAWFATVRGVGPDGPCFFGVCLDVQPMQGAGLIDGLLLLALTPADGQGSGSLSFPVPPGATTVPSAAFQVLFVPGAAPAAKSTAVTKFIQG